jgi:hypothetical protein
LRRIGSASFLFGLELNSERTVALYQLIFHVPGKGMNMAKAIRGKFPTSFGVSSPTGHAVMAFPNDESAELAREALLAGGFSENDVTHYTKEDVVTEFETSNEQVSIPVQIG